MALVHAGKVRVVNIKSVRKKKVRFVQLDWNLSSTLLKQDIATALSYPYCQREKKKYGLVYPSPYQV